MQTIQAGEVAAQNQINQLQKVLSAKKNQLQAEHDDLQVCQHWYFEILASSAFENDGLSTAQFDAMQLPFWD